jgi:NitT/TauT family transport system substrate-binding protein
MLLATTMSASARDLTPVTLVQSSLSFNFVPLYIAQTEGYFTDEGLKVDVVLAGGGPKAMTALLGGGGQFSASVLLDGMMAHRKGLDDVRAFATLSYFFNPMVVRADVAQARKLDLSKPLSERLPLMKGLKLGITTPGASSDMTVRFLALANGLSPDRDFQIVPLGGMQSQVAGIQAGQVDGCACLPGVDIVTKQQGLTVDLVKPGELTDLDGTTYGTLYGLASYNKAHPEVARAMARALVRATSLIADNPDAARTAARPFFKEMDEQTYLTSWATYLAYLPKVPLISREDFLRELAFEKVVMPPASYKPVSYDDAVDMSFVIAAMRDFKR